MIASDALLRQWRHLPEDAAVTCHFRCITYDLPYHGKSLPPLSKAWWAEEYRLARDFLIQVPDLLPVLEQIRGRGE